MSKDKYLIQLTIETLSSTSFELLIHKEARVKDLKRQIRYITHIPTTEQHILLGETELKDAYALEDYNLVNGTTLKLVTAMRGGPISYRPPPPPLYQIMAFLQAADRNDSEDGGDDFDDFDDNDDHDELAQVEIAYFISHDGKVIRITDTVEKKNPSEKKIKKDLVESESVIKKKAIREEENTKMKEKMANLKKNLEANAKEKDKYKKYQEMPQPQPPLKHYRTSKSADDKTKNTEKDKKQDIIAIEKEILTKRESQQKEYRNSLLFLSSEFFTSSNSLVVGESADNDLEKSKNNMSETNQNTKNNQKEKAKSAEKVQKAENISNRSMSIKKLELLPKTQSNSKQNATSEVRTQTLKPKVFQSNDAAEDKPIYTPGYNSSGYEEYVNNKLFSKKLNSKSKDSNTKLAARHTFPGVTPKRSKAPDVQNSMIWKGSTRSSKAEVKDLLNFVRKSIENKEKKNSIKKSLIKNESTSLNKTLMTENTKYLPPIMARKATIHTAADKFIKKPQDNLTRCGVCQKKLKMTENYTCKCNKHFCMKHRLPEQHNCDFDFKKEGKEKLAKENPKVESSKISKL